MSTKTRSKSKEPGAVSNSNRESNDRTFQDGPKGPTLSTPSLESIENENDSQPRAWVSVFRTQLAEDIEEKFNTRLDALQHDLDIRLSNLEKHVLDIEVKQGHHLQRIKYTEAIAQSNLNKLLATNAEIEMLKGRINSLTSELEDVRNRQMRKTLAFFGFPQHNGQRKRETWDDCKITLEKHLKSSGLGLPKVDRAHRASSRNEASSSSRSPSPIFAEFLSWQYANHVLRNKAKISKFTDSAGNGSKIKVEQWHSGATLDLRKTMLKIRRYFLSMNDGWKIKMSYPAILHINSGYGTNQIYKCSEDDLIKAEAYFSTLNEQIYNIPIRCITDCCLLVVV